MAASGSERFGSEEANAHSAPEPTHHTVPAFLQKTYEILENPAFQDFVCWDDAGETLVIKKVSEFSSLVLPKYFKHNNFQSFVRQLNMYSFHKVRHKSDWREFRHPNFRRGCRHLLHTIKRKSSTSSTPSSHSRTQSQALQTQRQEIVTNTQKLSTVAERVDNLERMVTNLNTRCACLERENHYLWQALADQGPSRFYRHDGRAPSGGGATPGSAAGAFGPSGFSASPWSPSGFPTDYAPPYAPGMPPMQPPPGVGGGFPHSHPYPGGPQSQHPDAAALGRHPHRAHKRDRPPAAKGEEEEADAAPPSAHRRRMAAEFGADRPPSRDYGSSDAASAYDSAGGAPTPSRSFRQVPPRLAGAAVAAGLGGMGAVSESGSMGVEGSDSSRGVSRTPYGMPLSGAGWAPDPMKAPPGAVDYATAHAPVHSQAHAQAQAQGRARPGSRSMSRSMSEDGMQALLEASERERARERDHTEAPPQPWDEGSSAAGRGSEEGEDDSEETTGAEVASADGDQQGMAAAAAAAAPRGAAMAAKQEAGGRHALATAAMAHE